jgi:hypothetical protein
MLTESRIYSQYIPPILFQIGPLPDADWLNTWFYDDTFASVWASIYSGSYSGDQNPTMDNLMKSRVLLGLISAPVEQVIYLGQRGSFSRSFRSSHYACK